MQTTGQGWRLGYRPALDGLRGVAVLIVVADHAGYLPMSAGSVGVTIFFVLSGFLITRLILEARQAGIWSAREFYLNRAVRLMPALVIMVGLVSAVFLAAGHSVASVAALAAPAVLYVENYMPSGGVFGHTWSLAIEEQFYLVWPLLLPLVLRCRRPVRLLVVVTICAMTFRVFSESGMLPAHSYGLLAGATFALAVARLGRAPRMAGLIGAAGIALSVFAISFDPDSLLPRVIAVPFALALVWFALGDGALLRNRTLRWVGRISYALYLWHFPLLGLAAVGRGGWAPLGVLAVSTVMAAGSTFCIEYPLRKAWRTRARKRSVGAVEPLQQEPDQALVLPR